MEETENLDSLVRDLKLNITNHALERYVNRVKDKTEIEDVSTLLTKYREKYEIELKKMFISSVLIYEGAIGRNNNPNTQVFSNPHGWNMILDKTNNTLITIYRADLGLGEDFNIPFREKSLKKIDEMHTFYNETKEHISRKISEYDSEIKSNEIRIKQLRKEISDLEDRNEALALLRKTEIVTTSEAFSEYRNSVESYIVKDVLDLSNFDTSPKK